MTAFTNYTEDNIITGLFRTGAFVKPTYLYIGLLTAVSSGETGSVTEVTGGSYARVQLDPGDSNWNASVGGNGTTSNAVTVTFPQATADWGTVVDFGIFDASTGGNLLVYAPLGTSRNIVNGVIASFAPTTLTVQVDNQAMNRYFFNVLIAIDQLINVFLFAGMPDETISARCWRERDKSLFWREFRRGVDFVFLHGFGVKNHCQGAYKSEQLRQELPVIYRQGAHHDRSVH